MGDEELRELAADFADLTETAQQVLRDEMRTRSLGDPQAPVQPQKQPGCFAASQWGEDAGSPDAEEADRETDLPHDYTWKTVLCECDEREEAWQIAEVLRRAGIESWIERPGSRYAMEFSYPRVLVAADQLDRAREIAARPIPREIVDLSRMEPPEFVAPRCPGCGAEDPVLEGVEPSNAWHCERCGREWTDPVTAEDEEQEKAGR
jgi:ribosomal protein S27E